MHAKHVDPADAVAVKKSKLYRVAICGEVSSGKSTVLNALLHDRLVPDNVGSDSRPLIVAASRETPGMEVVLADGSVDEAERIDDPEVLRGARHIHIWNDQPHLTNFDIIEVPLTKAEEVTESQLEWIRSCDLMIWVTIASQAWRLTEKQIIDRMGDARPRYSILAVSRADKMRSDKTRAKLMSRVERETKEYFEQCIFLHGGRKLLSQSSSSDEAWENTGAVTIMDALRDLANKLDKDREEMAKNAEEAAPEPEAEAVVPPSEMDAADLTEDIAPAPSEEPSEDVAAASEPVAEAEIEPEPEQEPEPAPAAAVQKSADNVALLRTFATNVKGAVAVGLLPDAEDGDTQVLAGAPETCLSLAEAVRSLRVAATLAGTVSDEGCPLQAVALSLSGHRLLLQEVPGKGVLFLLASSNDMSLGIAQNVMTRMCQSAEAVAA